MAATLTQPGFEMNCPRAIAAYANGAYEEPRWYAAYTVTRHEKCVERQLTERRLECFLPLYRSLHRWKDRRKEVESALFPSYVFVRIALKDRLTVLRLPSVVHLVSCNGTPVEIPDSEIEALRRLATNVSLAPWPYLNVGQQARICRGPLAGLEGFLVRIKDRFRVVLSVDLIMRSVAVEVDADDIEPVR
jgi:transcription antitermination factor NusG